MVVISEKEWLNVITCVSVVSDTGHTFNLKCWSYIALWNSKCVIDGYNVLDVHSKTGKGETKQTVALEKIIIVSCIHVKRYKDSKFS
jgi:hypothetical protein